MNEREELQALRRLAELEAKAAGQTGPSQREQRNAMFMRDLLAPARTVRDLAAGAVRGAGSIGATIVSPWDMARDAMAGRGLSLESNRRRRADIDAALSNLTGADTESTAYSGGKLLTEIAGTLGTGGAIANTVGRVAPAVANAPILTAIRSSGMTTGLNPATTGQRAADMGGRMLAGAVTGGASAGLVNPEDAATGAMFGGALPAAAKAAGWAGQKIAQGVRGAAKHGLGLTTGVGAEPVAQAFRAGRAGNREFVENMRGQAPLDDILARAKSGLDNMRAERSAQYRSGMVPIANDKSVLSFDDLERAFDQAAGVATYKGQIKNEAAAGAVGRMRAAVDEWRQLDPAEFHTPEGMDALKQKLGAIMESIPPTERGAKLAAGKVYNAAKSTIEAQAPTYAKVMRDYSEASEQITEIERALSLGDRASADTAMRKLQSLMRNNVQTNYGNRLALAESLEQGGNVELMPSIAGQAMSSWTPRSLAGQAGAGATGLGAFLTSNPLLLGMLPLQMPRAVGEAAYGLGRLSGGTSALMQPVASRLPPEALEAPNGLFQALYRAFPIVAADQ